MKLFGGYSPEQPQSSARPICQSHTMTNTGCEPATIRFAVYRSSPHYALRHRRRRKAPFRMAFTLSLQESYNAYEKIPWHSFLISSAWFLNRGDECPLKQFCRKNVHTSNLDICFIVEIYLWIMTLFLLVNLSSSLSSAVTILSILCRSSLVASW